MSTTKYTTDMWRQPDWMRTIKNCADMPEHNTYHECTPDTKGSFAGHIYVVYDKRKGTYNNMFYIGSTLMSDWKRKKYHLDECYSKMASSKLYIWMRDRCPTRAEAEENIILVYIHHVHFHKTLHDYETKQAILTQYERVWINDLYVPQRSLNLNLLSEANKRKARDAVREESKGVKLRQLLYNALGEVMEAEDLAEALCMVEDIRSMLLGGLTEAEREELTA